MADRVGEMIVLPNKKRRKAKVPDEIHLVCPGEVVTQGSGFMRGHGTYIGENNQLVSAVAGVVNRVNKVVRVRPFRSRYDGEIGDVVIGRITEVGQRRWKVDTQSRLDSVLKLSSVNLPGGILRRKSAEDELMMREFFAEGDLISAEVQAVHQEDGTLSLHTRSLKYGKLGCGSFLAVSSVLVKRSKNHFHTLPCGVGVVLGNNGYIWVGPPIQNQDPSGGAPKTEIDVEMRQRIARVRNVIVALADESLSLFDHTIIATYEASLGYNVKDLTVKEVKQEITEAARALCGVDDA